MDRYVKSLVCGVLWLIAANPALAQTFKTLANFDAETSGNSPSAPLPVGPDLNLYGTTAHDGANNSGGTLFEITSAGALTTLHSFCSARGNDDNCTDGRSPYAPLVLAANGEFYGTTYYGGITDHGVIFAFTPPPVPRAVTPSSVYSFCVQQQCPDGSNPAASLLEYSKGVFYGTTTTGGYVDNDGGSGTVFKFVAGHASLNTLFTFCIGEGVCTEGDNYNSSAGLVMASDGNLYGTTPSGGPAADDEGSAGTVFQVIPSSGAFQVIYDFCSQASCPTGLTPGPRESSQRCTASYPALKRRVRTAPVPPVR